MTLLHFSTGNRRPGGHQARRQDLRGGESGSAADLYADLAKVNVSPVDSAPLDISVSLRLLPEAAIAAIQASACIVERTKAQVADGNDDLVLAFVLDGAAIIRQCGRDEAVLRQGESYLYLNDRPHTTTVSPGTNSLHISMPRAWFVRTAKGTDVVAEGKLAPAAERSLLAQYARLLTAEGPLPAHLAGMAVGHLRDLAVLSLGAGQDAAEKAKKRGLRAARLEAVKVDIAANVGNPRLSLDWLAARHGISPRSLRALFYGESTSLTDFVLEARLSHAHRLLTRDYVEDRNIGAIALQSGFGDLSWFHQAFRRRFAMTPADAREAARNGRPAPGDRPESVRKPCLSPQAAESTD
jgi:AraC-like DNA-binding protein